MSANDIVGKITVGYQGWFGCPGDGNPLGDWWHYGSNRLIPPSATNTTIIAWPDVREFTTTYPTDWAALGGSGPAKVFSSFDAQTADTHFRWMRDNNIDTAALQRFNPTGGEGPIRDAAAAQVRTAAEAHNVKFYVMYDVTSWTSMQTQIKTDWTNKMSAYIASPAYAQQDGKPVVGIWGFGFNDPDHNFSAAVCLDVIAWFQAQGCYVMGGVPTYWRTEDHDSRAGFLATYLAFDCISPWLVGRIHTVADVDTFYTNLTVGDVALCHANGIHYQPCVLPGDLSLGDRVHGDFMWRQFYNMVRAGVDGIYVSMFDEFNEGNQIAKTAATAAELPTDGGFLALDEDGTACSSDYYLRLTRDGGRMLKGQLGLTATRPTDPQGVPTMTTRIRDPGIAPVAADLLACLTTAMADNPHPPKGISLRPTPVALYLSTTTDECCQGVAWVGLVNVFPSSSFPNPDATYRHDGTQQWAAVFELGAARCSPTPPANQIPSSDAWNTVTERVLDDAAAIRRAICCFETTRPDWMFLPGLWQPIPPDGGCVGGTQFLTVTIGACDC